MAWRAGRPAILSAAVAAGFAGGGALLADDAWREAWRPPLRLAFETLADREDGTAFAIVTGVLRADAVQRPSGASLSLDVLSIEPAAGPPTLYAKTERVGLHVRGGVLLTVAGELAGDRIDEWRAGRTIRASAQLRRASRYLNPGVADN